MPNRLNLFFLKVSLLALSLSLAGETSAAASSSPTDPGASPTRTLLFFGDSLTAGYGLSPEAAFPALIEQKIQENELPWEVVVGAVSGDTSAGGLRRIRWMMRRPVDGLVLALGSNDGLRGIDLQSTRKNLQQTIDIVREKHPEAWVVIAGMLMPPNMGAEYQAQFQQLYIDLAEANQAVLVPFLLEGVAGIPDLNLADGIHPNAKGQAKVAEHLWPFLRPLLESDGKPPPSLDPGR